MTLLVQKKSAKRTDAYRSWYDAMTDGVAQAIVSARVERVQKGLYGDVQPCGEGVSELRIDFGPGYRVYFTETLDNTLILLLLDGDKSTQKKDIKDAKRMLAEMKRQRQIILKTNAAITKPVSTPTGNSPLSAKKRKQP